MMQRVFKVRFSGQPPTPAALAATVQETLGVGIDPPVTVDNGFVLTTKTGEHVVLGVGPDEGIIYVEADISPSHLQWAVAAGLERLGGELSQPIPSFARKRLDEVKWWEKLKNRFSLF